jgi:hypothetical protein
MTMAALDFQKRRVGDMRVLTVAALFFAMSAAALGQAGEPRTSQVPASQVEHSQTAAGEVQNDQALADAQPVPDHIIYLLYFRHLANLDQVAAQREAEGKEGRGWRSHEQRAAGLSEEEGNILKQVAYDCIQAVTEADRKIQNVITNFHAQHPRGEYNRVPPPPELPQLEKEKTQIINAHIEQLKSLLGEDAFNKLAAHLNRDFKTSVKRLPVQSPPLRAKIPGGGR